MTDFYYSIKGKADPDNLSMSNWVFPPIFSGMVSAANKKEAKKFIEAEYGKSFPLRVLTKDLESNEFLLKIEDMSGKSYLYDLFEEKVCKVCTKKFRRIDLYNDTNTKYKGTEYCSDRCSQIGYEQRREEFSEAMCEANGNLPVIYKITNKATGKCYIGQTIQSFTLRWWQHIKWGMSDCKFHTAMQNSKVTDWIFEVIEICKSKEELNERESYHIRQNNSIHNGYNTAKVGDHEPDKNQKEIFEVVD